MDNVIISGTKVDMDDFSPEDVERYKKALIHALKHPPTGKERKSIADKARKEFTWSGVALQWSEEMS
jgi:hypothetical protein